MAILFRQAALDRLGAPEDLDEPLRITPPMLWLVGLSLAGLLAVAVLWVLLMVAGAATVSGSGALVASGPGSRLGAVVFVSPLDLRSVRPGASVEVTVAEYPGPRAGLLLATIASLGSVPATTAQMLGVLGRADQVRALTLAGQIFPVRLALRPDPRAANGFLWTLPAGSQVRLNAGLLVSAAIRRSS